MDTRELSGRPACPQTLLWPPLVLLISLRKLQIMGSCSHMLTCACRRVWDTHTGETLYTLKHNHIVRAVAFPPNNGQLLATGGMEKKLRIFDLSAVKTDGSEPVVIEPEKAFEVGPGVFQGTIKSIIWTQNPNIIVTSSDDKKVRWWDLNTREVVQELPVTGDIGSCELNFIDGKVSRSDVGGGLPVLSIAAGKTIYFYGGHDCMTPLKKIELPYEVASVAIHPGQRKIVTGGIKDTWAKVYNYDTMQELGKRDYFLKVGIQLC